MTSFALVAGVVAVVLVMRADLGRRHLSPTSRAGWRALTMFDVVCPAVAVGTALALTLQTASGGTLPFRSASTWTIAAALGIAAFAWSEGRRQIQFQRPTGIVLAESLILAGATALVEAAVFRGATAVALGISAAAIVAGGAVLAVTLPPFVKGYEGHRILERISEQGESVQAEYMPPTHECPRPELWKMLDSQTSEMEVLDFLKALVMTVKPRLIVETGTFIGYSAIKMAEGLKANGFGKVITIEYDPAIFAKAKERIDASGLREWIEYRNASSVETEIGGTIDLLFSDSHLPLREQEVRRFLPQVDPRGLILIHDSSSHFRVVREAALRLEHEGLISVVLLSTPRGLAVAQKREGRE